MTIDLATINFIPGQGGGGVIKSLSVTSNGVYSVSAGIDGYNPVDVDVHPSESLQRTYTSNGIYNIPGEYNGVEIEVNTPVPSGVMTITSNGIYDVVSFASASVDVPSPEFITEPLNVTSNGTYTPGQGVDGFSTVTVDVPQSVTGYTEKELTEGICITNLNNSASFVGSYAFTHNSCLTTVDLPVCSYIGEGAFNYCRSLSSVNLPVCSYVGNYAFQVCSSLSSVNLPVCSHIGNQVFQNCGSLTTVNLPVCSYIGNQAFDSCRSLSSINLPVCSYIDGYVFRNTGLISVSLPHLVKIGGYATFDHCKSLSSLYFPKLRLIIGNWTFNNCINLSILDMPAVSINGNNLVERDSNLKELYINSETYIIPSYILSNTNSGITSIYTNINNVSRFIAASGWSTYSDKIIGVGDPSVFMLSYSDGVVNGMTKLIGQGYYSYLDMSSDVARTNVVSVDLPNCDYIFSNTFAEYSGLTNISLPNCEYVGSYAFQVCGSLSSVNLPVCSYIGNNAFYNCPSLSVAYIGTSIDTVCVLENIFVFDACPALTSIYVPASLVESYKTATNWTSYSDRIVGI